MRARTFLIAIAIATFLSGSILLAYFMSQVNKPEMSGKGTIRYIDIEGGFYGIIGDDGKHYDPMNLDEKYQVDGLRVYFEANICHDCDGFHMWGDIVTLLKIEKLE